MNWTWLGLAVLVLLAFSMVDGYRHGFVKEVVSALLVLISVALGMADQSLCESVHT